MNCVQVFPLLMKLAICCYEINFFNKFGSWIPLLCPNWRFQAKNYTGDRQIAKLAIFGPKNTKKKYGSKCLELSNSSRNQIKIFDLTVRPHSADVRTAQCGQDIQFDVRNNRYVLVLWRILTPSWIFSKSIE